MRGECALCGRWAELERHHMIGGTANRRLSEQYGLVIYLCAECHRTGKHAAHRDKGTQILLHRMAQRTWMEEQNATVEDFIHVFGKNFLEGDADDT